MFPADSISVTVSAGKGGNTASVSERFKLDDSTALQGEDLIGNAEISQSRILEGVGENQLLQMMSGSNGMDKYTAENSVKGAGSLSLSVHSLSKGNDVSLSQNVVASGSAELSQMVAHDCDKIDHRVELDEGNLKAAQKLGSVSGEISTAADVSTQGTSSVRADAQDGGCYSAYGASTENNGGSAPEMLSGTLYAAAGSPKMAFGSTSATGDKVVFQSVSAGPQGTLTMSDAQQDVTGSIIRTQQVATNPRLSSATWSSSGSGTLNPITKTWTSADGLRSVSNQVSGTGSQYTLSGGASIGTDSVYMYQNLRVDGKLDTIQTSKATNNGRNLETNNQLSSDGLAQGVQRAGADTSKVYTSQDIVLHGGSASDSTWSKANKLLTAPDQSFSSVTVTNPYELELSTSSIAFNNKLDAPDGADPYCYRTSSIINMLGGADKAQADTNAVYHDTLNEYKTIAHGEYDSKIVGYLSTSAKTVRAAVANLEITAYNSNQAGGYSCAGKNSMPTYSDVGMGANKIDQSSKLSKVQLHLYSHAYPENNHGNSNDEYVSTGTLGINGINVGASLLRPAKGLEDAASSIDKSAIINSPTVWRATDITFNPVSTRNYVHTWDKDWVVPTRPESPPEKVPWGIKMMYNNEGLYQPTGGAGVDVAVIDKGADTLHPDLVMRIDEFANYSGAIEYGDMKFTDTDGNQRLIADKNGHGTHVCGTIAADGGFDGGGIWGMAPQSHLHVYTGSSATGIYRATDLGSDIISISLSTYGDDSAAINYAGNNKVSIIAGAGNGMDNYDSVIAYPASNSNVVAVGMVTINGDAMWWTSPGYNNGDYKIDEKEVMFGAPGVDVNSTTPTFLPNTLWDHKPWYDKLSGTSMATPHISGTVVKLLSNNLYRGYSGEDVIGVMQGYARRNDVQYVWTGDWDSFGPYSDTERARLEQKILDNNYINYGGSVGAYYLYLYSCFSNGRLRVKPPILRGDDCLTGLGIPKLPYGSF